jgi:hypothetical protein
MIKIKASRKKMNINGRGIAKILTQITLFILFIDDRIKSVAAGACQLPVNWHGKWYQSKDAELLSISRTSFLNRGACIEQRQDKFIFYER